MKFFKQIKQNIFDLFHKTNKYEFTTINTHGGYGHDRVSKAQDEGWEVCGLSCIKYHEGVTNSAYMYIPFRRKIKA